MPSSSNTKMVSTRLTFNEYVELIKFCAANKLTVADYLIIKLFPLSLQGGSDTTALETANKTIANLKSQLATANAETAKVSASLKEEQKKSNLLKSHLSTAISNLNFAIKDYFDSNAFGKADFKKAVTKGLEAYFTPVVSNGQAKPVTSK